MKKCVITGKETLDKSNNIPVSREGRKILTDITKSHNEKIFLVYKEKSKEANHGLDLDEATLRRFAPTIKKSRVIELLIAEEKDIMETKAEILDEA